MAAIRVRITQVGFIGANIRRVGDEITLADKRYFSERWMELLHEVPSISSEPEQSVEAPVDGELAEEVQARGKRSK